MSVFDPSPRRRWRLTSTQWKWLKRAAWGLPALGILLALGGWLAVWAEWLGPLPTAKELAYIRQHTASEIYAADGTLLGKYYVENRTRVAYGDISPFLIDALVATEDARFYEHSGIDVRSLARVAVKSILLMDESSGGGSTLSQQLAKNLYPRESYWLFSLPINKVREMIVARRLERVYSKEEILALYLNTVPFGESVFGIGAATQRFFSVSPADLNPEQAATLVGMLKATTAYNPRRHPERALGRRSVVLGQMVTYGYLDSLRADSLRELPLGLDYRNVTRSDGLAPHFRDQVAADLKAWFAEHPGPDGRSYNLYTDGLKVYTTLDPQLQRLAEAAVNGHMQALQQTFDAHWADRSLWEEDDSEFLKAVRQSPRYQNRQAAGQEETEILAALAKPEPMRIWTWEEGYVEKEMSPLDSVRHYLSFLQAGFLAMEPQTGYVLAWVGGINHKVFKYDHVTSRRQVGSTFKPIIYTAALEAGIDPCHYFSAAKKTYPQYKNWSPGNADGQYGGYYSMRGALTNSVNTVSAAMIDTVGVVQAHRFASQFGFEQELPQEPSLVLGTADLSLQEMVGAYSVFANEGQRARPVYLTRVEDAQGNVIIEFPVEPKREAVVDATIANMMVRMLQSVVDSGTASRLRRVYGLRGPLAGKTGTTQDQTDGWFIGFTPKLVVGAWVGGDSRQVRFRSLRLGQGANTALPIAGLFLQQTRKAQPQLLSAEFPSLGVSALQSMDCANYLDQPPQERTGLMKLIEMLKEKQERKRMEREREGEERKDKWYQLFQRKNQNR